MRMSLAMLVIFGTASVQAAAQTAPSASAPVVSQAQPAKPQMIKKRVCEQVDEDPYSRLGNRKICKTIEVPAPNSGSGSQQPPAPGSERGN